MVHYIVTRLNRLPWLLQPSISHFVPICQKGISWTHTADNVS